MGVVWKLSGTRGIGAAGILEPEGDVAEAPDGVLDVIIRTADDVELDALRETRRRAPKRAH